MKHLDRLEIEVSIKKRILDDVGMVFVLLLLFWIAYYFIS